MTPTEAALRAALEAEEAYQAHWKGCPICDEMIAGECFIATDMGKLALKLRRKALAAPPHGKDALDYCPHGRVGADVDTCPQCVRGKDAGEETFTKEQLDKAINTGVTWFIDSTWKEAIEAAWKAARTNVWLEDAGEYPPQGRSEDDELKQEQREHAATSRQRDAVQARLTKAEANYKEALVAFLERNAQAVELRARLKEAEALLALGNTIPGRLASVEEIRAFLEDGGHE
jgi:hypothetical protein